MILDPNTLSYWIMGFGFAASGMSVAFLTDFGCGLDESHKVLRFLFKGNIRSLVSSELFLVLGLIFASLIEPWNSYEIMNEGLIWGLGLIVVAPLFFMNVKIGSISWASRDNIRKIRLLAVIEESTRSGRHVTFIYENLKRIISCMLRGVMRGNKGSAKHLAELAKRDDELGFNVRRAIVELSDDLSTISRLLDIDFGEFSVSTNGLSNQLSNATQDE